MLKRILPVVVLLTFVLPLQAQTWVRLNPGTGIKLRDVFFTSRDTGYVVGDDSLILRTYDGGLTWTNLPPVGISMPGNLQAIWMLNSASGFLAPEFLYDLPATANGGASWSSASSPGNPCYPDGLFFDSPGEGFIYGRGCFGGAYLAKWNGSSWGLDQQIFYGVTPNSGLIGMRGMAKDASSGAYVAVGDYGKIFRSTNAFQNWDTIAYADTTNFTAVDYAGNNTFYASASEVINSIFISTDGGQTFAYDQTYNPTFYYSGFEDIDMLTNGFGVAVGFSQTTGGGFIQWRNTTGWGFGFQPVNERQHAVFVVDSTRAYSVGDSGSIYRWDIPTGINEQVSGENLLPVFPQPVAVSGDLQLQLPGDESWDLAFYSVEGKLLGRSDNHRKTASVKVSLFAQSSGMYFLRVRSSASGKTLSSKILVW